MNENREFDRPVPRGLHAWAVLTVLVTLVLLVLGQFVTSFRAGMADPIWPTEPWYLFDNYKFDLGYLIEHSHRIAGWIVGGVTAILAIGVWFTEPRKSVRWIGLLGLFVLLAGYAQFHYELRKQKLAVEVEWPMRSIATMAVGLVIAAGSALSGVLSGLRGSGLRVLGLLALIAVMIQGLLGGFRVRLDAILGPELAPIHGVFAQVVFCLLVSLAALTGRPVTTELPDGSRRLLSRLSFALVGLLFVQLIWGAMVRHAPNALNQRLHLLTAFLAVALAVWLIRVGFATPAARARIAFTGWVLGLLIALQVTLGVEAWMGKFGEEARGGKPAATHFAEAEPVSKKQATMRTAHTLVGTGVLATAVVFALRIRSRKGAIHDTQTASDVLWDRMLTPEPAMELTAPGKTP